MKYTYQFNKLIQNVLRIIEVEGKSGDDLVQVPAQSRVWLLTAESSFEYLQ